ncbi:MAG: hypothetical protein M3075_04895, partial [Candidatus Dormibacteraeota bacterium]|nr:hypothetical protein [Candidatus Dormibacteraeota bacterium]
TSHGREGTSKWGKATVDLEAHRQTTLNKLAWETQNSKAAGQQLADRAAFWLVPVALVGGHVTLADWLLAAGPSTSPFWALPSSRPLCLPAMFATDSVLS